MCRFVDSAGHGITVTSIVYICIFIYRVFLFICIFMDSAGHGIIQPSSTKLAHKQLCSRDSQIHLWFAIVERIIWEERQSRIESPNTTYSIANYAPHEIEYATRIRCYLSSHGVLYTCKSYVVACSALLIRAARYLMGWQAPQTSIQREGGLNQESPIKIGEGVYS